MWDQILLFIAVGFAAQIVDGALGMAYGLTATSVLLGFGVAPPVASASVHAAEVFTTGASGLAHWRLGNISRGLILRLAIPGMIGGALGAFVLVQLPIDLIRLLVNLYLLLMGGLILWWGTHRKPASDNPPRHVSALGLVGGFLDALGGGGWGAIVTSSLLGQGAAPRKVIGSVNLAEFFVTVTVTATFVTTIGLELWPMIVGLIIGGVLAAPFAAYATSRLPDRVLMILVGGLIVLLSLRGFVTILS